MTNTMLETLVQNRKGEGVVFDNTQSVQMISLYKFAKSLDYTWDNEYRGFIDNRNKSSMRKVKFSTMVDWHNTNFTDEYVRNIQAIDDEDIPDSDQYWVSMFEITGFTDEEMLKAVKSKVVKQVKMHYSKQQNKFIVQDHQVHYCVNKGE